MVRCNLCTILLLFTANASAKPVDPNARIDDSSLDDHDKSHARIFEPIKNITANEKVSFGAPGYVIGFNGTALAGSSEIDWSQTILSYNKFENLVSPGLLDRPDHDVFFYSTENVISSRVFEWNMAWTMKYADHPNMKNPEYGEDWLRAYHFLDDPGYACGISEATCTRYTREFILDKYSDPQDRAKAQRIFLIFEANYISHQIEQMKLVCY